MNSYLGLGVITTQCKYALIATSYPKLVIKPYYKISWYLVGA